jgi:Zn-dependent protease with chaperone function
VRGGSVRQSLGAIVLGFESIVMFFAALVVFGLKALPAPVALIGGAVLCLLLLANAALLRYRWAYALGWVLQGVIVLVCFLVPLLSIVAVIFIGLWIYCMVKGASIDRQNARVASETPSRDESGNPEGTS